MQGIDFGPDLKVRLPDRFNVAVPFIDRHVGEGRGAKAASRTVSGEPALKQVAVKALTVDAFLPELDKSSAKLEARLAAPMDDCFWLYSSGSTGRPKGTVHMHQSMVVTSELFGVRVLGIRESDVSF